MKLVSLKRTPKERKEANSPQPSDGELYPYGARVDLDKTQVEALGFKLATLPRTGTKVKIDATGFIRSSRAELGEKDEDSLTLSIQLTDIGVEEPAADRKARKGADRLNELGRPTR